MQLTYGKRGFFVRIIYLIIAIIYFIGQKLLGSSASKSLVVLCYHGVRSHQRLKFEKQVRIFTNHIDHNGHLTLELTFDDAFQNLTFSVLPIVKSIAIPIKIFVPTGSIGRCPEWLSDQDHFDRHEKVMSVDQLRSLVNDNFVVIGSHTVNHLRLTRLSDEKIRFQLSESRKYLKGILDGEIYDIALPNGDYNERVLQLAYEVGYKTVYTLDPLVNDYSDEKNIPLKNRFSISPDDWLIETYLTINGSYNWLQTWRSFIKRIKL